MEPSEETDLDALMAWIDASGMLDPSFRFSDHIDPENLLRASSQLRPLGHRRCQMKDFRNTQFDIFRARLDSLTATEINHLCDESNPLYVALCEVLNAHSAMPMNSRVWACEVLRELIYQMAVAEESR